MTRKTILLCSFILFIILSLKANDSLKVSNKIDTNSNNESSTINQKEIVKTAEDGSTKNYIIVFGTILSVCISSFVAYRIANKQNRHKLIDTKIGVLKSKKEKLEKIKNEVYERKVQLTGNSIVDQNSFIDRLHQDITSVMKNSELFDSSFTGELESYEQRMSNYYFAAKNGKQLDVSSLADLEKVPILDKKIKSTINSKLSDIENKIDKLVEE